MDSTDLPRTPGIYKIFFLDPNLFYIGSAANLRERCRVHLRDLRKGAHHNIHLQRAYAIHGVDAIHFEMVEPVERKEDLIEREQYYLDTLHPHYNIHPEARSPLGMKRSPETRTKLSVLHKGKSPANKGKHASDETRARLSVSHMGQTPWNKGKPCSEEEQQRLRTLTLGVSSWNKGIPMREKTKQKQREERIGKPNPHPGNSGPPTFTPLGLATRNAKIRATLIARSPEQKAEALAKNRATWEAKGPEARAQAVEKRRATMAAKKASK